MLTCYRRRERSRLGALYCWGLPERDRGRLPCRLIDAALPWTPPEEYADPGLLPSLLEAQANETFAALCPAYDAESVERAARPGWAAIPRLALRSNACSGTSTSTWWTGLDLPHWVRSAQ